MKKRFTEEQIIGILKMHENETPIKEIFVSTISVIRLSIDGNPNTVEISNVRWSLDFVSDTLVNGRKFCALKVIDKATWECLALEMDKSRGTWDKSSQCTEAI